MKNILILSLTLLTISASFAQDRGPMPRDPRAPGSPSDRPGDNRPGDNRPGGDRDDLAMCLKNLNNAQSSITDLSISLNRCQSTNNPMEMDRLRRDNQRLTQDNANLQGSINGLSQNVANLQRENQDLRRQLEQQRPPQRNGFISYAGCTSVSGVVDARYLASATGFFPIEAEANAVSETQKQYSCNYGAKVVQTEEIKTTESLNYCTAGCVSVSGVVDARYVVGERGRNATEAAFNALKKAQTTYTCNYGAKVQNCQ